MKILIVFEDTYGIADIFKSIKKIDLDKQFVAVCEDVYSYSGACNVSVFKLNREIKAIIKELKITDVVSVFDVDTVNGNNNIVTGVELQYLISKNKDIEIRQWFMPIVYNAETVMLHQYIKANKCKNLDVIDMVSSWSVRKLHLNILQGILMEIYGNVDAKLVRQYLNIEMLQNGYRCSIREEDACFKKWLLDSCPTENEYFQDKEDVMNTLLMISKHVQTKLACGKKIFSVGNKYKIDCSVSNKEQVAVEIIKNTDTWNLGDDGVLDDEI
jgi:hypothetical protein